MEFRVLGPIEVLDSEGNALSLGPPRQHALLAVLLLHAGTPLSVDRLVELLWADAAPETAATIVHGSIAGLRRALQARGVKAILLTRKDGYLLDARGEQIDSLRFERLLAEGRRSLGADPGRASAALSEALSLWRGPAMTGIDNDFVRDAALRLEELRLDALETWVEAGLALGRHEELVGELRTLVAEHPLRERLWGFLMTALYRCGRQADAQAAYRRVHRILRDELGVTPGPELRDLEHAVLQHRPSLDPPGAARRPRLPQPLGAFVGRAHERQELGSFLHDHQLVSVVGPAGVGKTRLAVEVARSVSGRFAAGAWFVDLAPLATSQLVAQTVADVLGVRAEPGMAIADTVAAAMGARDALVVLDNCEHLVEACANLVAAVVSAGSAVRVVVTTRQPLGVPGEVIYAVPPLPIADVDEPWHAVAGSEAVWLFGARAAAARPGFRVTEDNARLVRDICDRLDGLPLALELAAARVATLPLRHIAERLDDRFRLLDTGSGATPARHRGLRAAVEWSYDLLTDAEQRLFNRLSVFAGGFTLEAAEAVAADEQLAERDVAALLSGLVSRSLVQQPELAPEQGRYRMLDTLRGYGRERLDASHETGAVRERHARHYLALVEEAEPHLFRAGSRPWLERLRAEDENLRGALEWSFEPGGDPHVGTTLATGLWHVWDLSGMRVEGMHWVQAALRGDAGADAAERAALLATAALLQLGLGELDAAHEIATQQLELARLTGDTRWEGDALTRLGTVAWARADLDVAESLHQQAVRTLHAADDPWRTAIAEIHLARVRRDRDELREARAGAETALDAARRVGEDTAHGFALDVLASIVRRLGELDLATELVEEALTRYRTVAYREGEVSALHTRAGLLLEQGEPHAAADNFANALELCNRIGHRAAATASLEGLAQATSLTGDAESAVVLLGAAAARREALGVPVPPADRSGWNHEWTQLRLTLGADRFERAWHAGAQMSLEDLLHRSTENPSATSTSLP